MVGPGTYAVCKKCVEELDTAERMRRIAETMARSGQFKQCGNVKEYPIERASGRTRTSRYRKDLRKSSWSTPQVSPNRAPATRIQLTAKVRCGVDHLRSNPSDAIIPVELEESGMMTAPKAILHPIIAETKAAAATCRPGLYGFLYVGERVGLRLRVGPGSLDRALDLMDRLFRMAEEKGHHVLLGTRTNMHACVRIGQDEVPIQVRETVRLVPFSEGKCGPEEQPRYHRDRKFHRVPSGRLTIVVNHNHFWAEGVRWRNDDRLPKILKGIEDIAERHLKPARIEREYRDKIRQVELLATQAAEDYRLRVEKLCQQAFAWHKSKVLRDFVEVIRTALDCKSSPALEEWVAMALREAERLDPTLKVARSLQDENEG
jgi:hypothetical protein